MVRNVVETDASHNGLGAVLGQKQPDGHVHPVAYASRSLQIHEKAYGVTELETLDLVWAVKHFRSYFLGHHTTVFTDHSACTSLSKPSAKLARWAMIVQEFDLTIRHRSGKSNSNADALSRNPAPKLYAASHVLLVSAEEEVQCQQQALVNNQEADENLRTVLQYLRNGTLPESEVLAKKVVLEATQYDIINGVLQHENPHQPGQWRVVVPVGQREKMLKRERFSCHFAWKKM